MRKEETKKGHRGIFPRGYVTILYIVAVVINVTICKLYLSKPDI